MKSIKTDNTGGMPLKQYTLQKLQESYFELFYSMISYLGINRTTGKYIISGCEIVGADITAGWMFIDGDLVYFAGSIGDATTKFKKAITAETAAFKSGENKPLYYTSVVQIDPTGTLITDFVRVNPIITLPDGLVIDPAFGSEPAEPTLIERLTEIEKKVAVFQTGGGMVLWNKPAIEIPEGWQEVADWRGRMPVGFKSDDVDFNVIGETGGNKSITLSAANMPKEDIRPIAVGSTFNASVIKTDGDVVGNTPDPTAVNIMNPYRVVYFIEYIG